MAWKHRIGKPPWNKGLHGMQSPPWNKGKRMTEEQRARLRVPKKVPSWKKGKKLGFIPSKAFKKGQIPWNKGKKTGSLSAEHKKKISISHKGNRSYLWKGGITPIHRALRTTTEYLTNRDASKKRDDYTCQMPKCGLQGGRLHSHHIKPFSKYPDLINELSNFITLCESCHLKIKHKEEQFEELFTSTIKSKALSRETINV